MKKLYSHFGKIFLALVYSAVSFAANAQSSATLQPDLSGYCVGDIVTVPIYVTGNGVGTLSFRLDFDRTVLLNPSTAAQPFYTFPRANWTVTHNWDNVAGVTQSVDMYYAGSLPNGENFSNTRVINLIYIYNGGNTTIHIRKSPEDGSPFSSISDIIGENLTPFTFTDNMISSVGSAGIITGTPVLTPGAASVPYSVAPISSATSYIWSYSGSGVTINGNGSSNITLDFTLGATPGQLSVYGSNSCGNGTTSILNIAPVYSTLTWNGSQSTNWITASNWTPNLVPSSTNNIIIPLVSNQPIVNEDVSTPATCYNLTLNSEASLTIAAGKALTVVGSITNNAGNTGIVIKSNAGGTGSLITSSNTTATVERFMTGSVWHLISSPVSGLSIPTFVSSHASLIQMNIAKYGLGPYINLGSNPNWEPFTTTMLPYVGNFIVAKGYEILLKPSGGTAAFAGTIVANNKAFSITTPVPGNNWNLVGNPFTAPIKAANVETGDFLSTNASKLDDALQALYVWNGTGYSIINNLSGSSYISVGQSFFVKAKAAGTLNFNAAMRSHTGAPFYKNTETAWPLIDLKADIGDKSSKTQIYFVTGTTPGLDPGYDAGMFDGTGSGNSIYTHIEGSDVAFGIQSLPDNEYRKNAISVGLNAPEGVTVNFTSETSNLPSYAQVFLQDRVTGTVTRLDTPGSSYSVTLKDASTGIGRFYLYTAPLTVGNDQLKEEVYTIIPLPKANKIRLIGTFPVGSQVTLFDMNGRNLGMSRLTNNAENEVQFAPDANGIYIVRITGGTTVLNRKITWMR